ncbi:protein adenylyltransferase SelO [Magnetococcales bacterium HHB-1]
MNQIGWSFDNSFARLPEKLFTRLKPVPVKNPKVVILNESLAGQLGLDVSILDLKQRAWLFSGNLLPEGSEPLAQAYAGHQFGHFTMLGDGRAIVLGEQITPNQNRFDIQFKGSGRTPYSRNGDGRAALGPMLREYIISESMHALGIPTTRSLAVTTTGEPVFRETMEIGAILTRVASSHLRVGTFQYLAMHGEIGILRQLIDYALKRHYPERQGEKNPALALLSGVMERQIDLIIQWLRVGFIHGVMNTDNVAISGETIDYGPCAFMDVYNPATVFSSIDHEGRYAYGNQPNIARWNCARFAETLLPLLHDKEETAIEMATEVIDGFNARFDACWIEMMRNKLGLFGKETEDLTLINELLDWIEMKEADYTRTFRALTIKHIPKEPLFQEDAFQAWHKRWRIRVTRNGSSMDRAHKQMLVTNPAIIPRNHKVEEALDAAIADGNMAPLENLLAAIANPYEDNPKLEPYQTPPDPGARIYQTFCGT